MLSRQQNINLKTIIDRFFKFGKCNSFPCNDLQQRMQNCEITKKEKVSSYSKRKKL